MKPSSTIAIPMTSPTIEHIRLLSNQLDQLYRSMKAERQAISQWEEEQEFSILGTLEIFSDDIQGYIEQIVSNQVTSSTESILNHLQKLNIFNIDYFTAWYFTNWENYPKIKQYIDHLDHLRLLLSEQLSAKIPIAA
jgi:hypothetical protein